jgi:lysophospholipase L1-like esterase
MLECLIVGDSIAKGVGQVRTECVTLAQTGITSHDWNNTYNRKIQPARTTIISLGSNDYRLLNTQIELVALRHRVASDRVFWIVPANQSRKQEIVQKIARSYGDTFITIPELSPDGVHPTARGYRMLGKLTK